VKSEEKEKPNSSPGPSARQAEAGHAKGKLPHDQPTPGRGLQARSGSGGGAGDGKDAGSGDSALAAYVGILTDRFQAAWNQPTSEMALGKTLEVTVKLKVEADGTVTEFVIVEGSGNTVVDDSVRDAGKKITKLPPPPNGQGFSAPVRFELGN
jgi:TonB family protein